MEDQAIVDSYKANGRKPTLEKFNLTDPKLYAILKKGGVKLKGRKAAAGNEQANARRRARYKARRGHEKRTGRGGKGRLTTPPRASYKPRRGSLKGGAADALVYLLKARDRLLMRLGGTYTDTGATLGLISLAIEALGGEL
jgi:hypothetical protein